MNILWVEDFDEGKGARVPLTQEWLNTILCEKTKERLRMLGEDTMPDPLSFMEALANNDSPIVWADSLASGLAAATLGTAAYRGNKFSKLPLIKAGYEVALLDLAIPYKKDGGQLSDMYSERAQAFLDAEERNRTFDLRESGLDTFPGIILAMRLMQQGMPAERIFVLTANADVSSMPVSLRCLAGPELLKNNIINKNKIGDLLRRIENNVYYQLKIFISSVSAEVLSFVKQAEFMGTTRKEFDFKKPRRANGIGKAYDEDDDEYFLFEKKKETLNFLKELIKILPMYIRKCDRGIYYNTIINKILIEFDNVKTLYMQSKGKEGSYPKEYEDSIPARFYIRNLKYLRNINAHTNYMKGLNEYEVGIIFLIFIGYIIEVYRCNNNELYNCKNIILKFNKFVNNIIVNDNYEDVCWDTNNFIHDIGSKYMNIVRGNNDFNNQYKMRFSNITSDFQDGLNLTAWDVLRLTFWSQVSYTSATGPRHNFHDEAQILKTRPFFSMLCDRLALCENEIKGGVEE